MTQSKYFNKKTNADGLRFDSKKESVRWLQLKQQEADGLITKLERQVNFDCIVNWQKICKYVADFTYYNKSGVFIVEDVKSSFSKKMPVYRIKKKLLKACYGIDIFET